MNDRPEQQPDAAEIFLRQLGASGVDWLFANGGTDFPPIVEAYARLAGSNHPVPVPMTVPHENAAVSMAHGATMILGRPQAVMVHVNVGTANTINGVLNAARDQTPMMVLAGRTPYAEQGRHGARSRNIHWAQEMFDQAGMLREAVKWDGELRDPEQAGDLARRGLSIAMTAPRGPVYATLPRDTLAAPVRRAAVAAVPLAYPAAPLPEPQALEQAAQWLAAAERPLIITSAAGRTREGFEALSRFAGRFACPVISFTPRFVNIPADHPMHMGYEPGPLLAEADCVLVVDTDVPWIPHLEGPPAGCRVIHLGPDPLFTRYPMRSFPCDLAITADPAPGLEGIAAALAPMLPEDDAALTARRERISARSAAQRAAWAAAVAAPPPGAITPEWLSHCIGEAVGEEAVIVNEYPLRQPYCPRRRWGSFYGQSTAGGLGWGFGAALGAKLALKDRLVVTTLGDGAYVFNNPAACHWVAQAHDLPVLAIVFNNRMYGAVRNSTLAMYRDGAAARDGGTLLADLSPAPDFEAYAQASGGYGEKVSDPRELPAALGRAIHAVTVERRQALLNVICDY
ncbi:thiamine pyrophosphate-requiring protein [Roseomonas marmotae]|uniref:Thiamine pyrophosphate-requiring protein n=1 Tax=Roseomonas marmotae TaxID=2768161 RepID=A0ABS3KGP8_9PROT|nr:thiamine pyrophosphate-requiring protein [Roseomonas marmotae]MBO1076100.1 thiamine pyrophosphate-requiring protein [Roseomonas marmotae]QTI81336.1 thiamine pyrophosphate-requiring protein [Roseomonas marmotae]